MFIAAESGKLEIIKLLLEHSFDINLLDHLGESPIFKAARNNCVGVFKYLHKNGAQLEIINNNGETLNDIINFRGNELLKNYFSLEFLNPVKKNRCYKQSNNHYKNNSYNELEITNYTDKKDLNKQKAQNYITEKSNEEEIEQVVSKK